jgi:hypothetical protein
LHALRHLSEEGVDIVDSSKRPDRAGVNRFLKVFGIALVLSGLGHSAGVLHFYMTGKVPEANRILLDIWIAEALFLGGGLYLGATCGTHTSKSARTLAIFGSLTIIGCILPMIPVLFMRAPVVFRIPAVIYFVLSVFVLFKANRVGSGL